METETDGNGAGTPHASTYAAIATFNHATAAYRPTLTVTYTEGACGGKKDNTNSLRG